MPSNLDYRTMGGRIGGATALPFNEVLLTPGDFVATATGTPPTLTNNNNVEVWSFADAATGEITASIQLPGSWRTASVSFFWCNGGAGAGDVRWRVAYKKLDSGNLTSEAFTADTSANVTAGAQNAVTPRVAHLTGLDVSPSVFGTTTCLFFSRIGADAGDTLANAAHLLAAVFQRQS